MDWVQMVVRSCFMLVVPFVFAAGVMASVAQAGDLSGEYFGVKKAQGLVLTVSQSGSVLKGEIKGESVVDAKISFWKMEFSGANDGSNMANVGMTLDVNGQSHRGFMILRWHHEGIQASVIVKGDRVLSGQYQFSATRP